MVVLKAFVAVYALLHDLRWLEPLLLGAAWCAFVVTFGLYLRRWLRR